MPCTEPVSCRRRSAPSRSPAPDSRARSSARAARPGGGRSGGSCRSRLELGDRHLLDLAERELEEALAEDAEALRVAGRQKAVAPLAARLVLEPLALERLGDLARGLLGREDERHAAPEGALKDR